MPCMRSMYPLYSQNEMLPSPTFLWARGVGGAFMQSLHDIVVQSFTMHVIYNDHWIHVLNSKKHGCSPFNSLPSACTRCGFSHSSCVMFRVETLWILLGSVSLLCRAFPKDTELSGWSVYDFHEEFARQQVLTLVAGLFGTKSFRCKFIQLSCK